MFIKHTNSQTFDHQTRRTTQCKKTLYNITIHKSARTDIQHNINLST